MSNTNVIIKSKNKCLLKNINAKQTMLNNKKNKTNSNLVSRFREQILSNDQMGGELKESTVIKP